MAQFGVSSHDFATHSVSLPQLYEDHHADSFDSDIGLFRNAHAVK